ncbi:MAG: hypothetical protein OEY59_04310 [Deltaproteobacteria bacterium]|nr:hypothetical protein [Deltaproteobacteria bacterium]
MGRFLLKNIFWFAVIVQFCLTASVSAQNNQGNVLSEVRVSNNGKMLELVGSFNKSKLGKLKIENSFEDKSISIFLPWSVVDPVAIPNNEVSLPESDSLDSLTINENISKDQKGTQPNVEVEILINTKKDTHASQLDVTSNKIRISLLNKAEYLKREEERLKAENERKEQEARAMALEQSKKDAIRMDQERAKMEEIAKQKAIEATEVIVKRFKEKKIKMMQVSIINASGHPKRAYKLSVFLGRLQKNYIEKTLGAKIDIINISNSYKSDQSQTSIHFRDNYLKPALFLANLIPGEQRIISMEDQTQKTGIDIEIFLGKDYN